MATFSERFKYLRENIKSWTQQDAANNLGVSRSTIAGYESKNRIPREEILFKIADTFDVSVDYLLGRVEEKRPGLIKDAKNAFIKKAITQASISFNIRQAFEIAMNYISKNEFEIHDHIIEEVLKTANLFNCKVYEGFFSTTTELRTVFYALPTNQLDILDLLYQLFYRTNNIDKEEMNFYFESSRFNFSGKSQASFYEKWKKLVDKVNSDETDMTVVLNPLFIYLTTIEFISKKRENEEYYLRSLKDYPLKNNGKKNDVIQPDLLEQYNLLKEKGLEITNQKAIKYKPLNKLYVTGAEENISPEEAIYLRDSLDVYRKHKQ